MAILDLKPKETGFGKLEFTRLPSQQLAQRDIQIEEAKQQQRLSEIESRPISSFLLNAVDSALLSPKVTDFLTLGGLKEVREEMLLKNPTASLLGNIAGYIVPGTLATKGVKAGLKGATKLGLKAGVSGGSKAIPKATKAISRTLKASRPLRIGVEEGIAGAGIGLAQGIVEGEGTQDIAKRMALEGAIGAVGGAAFGRLFSGKSKITKSADEVASEIKDRFKLRDRLIRVEDKKIAAKLKATKEAKLKPVTRTPNSIKTDIEKARIKAETDIAKIKTETPSGNVRKREINKIKKVRNYEVEKLNKELKQIGEPEIKIEEGRKIAPTKIEAPKVETKPMPKVDTDIEAKVSKIKEQFKSQREVVEKGFQTPEIKGKRLKAIGVQESAEIRKARQGEKLIPIEGGLTSKELNKKITKLKSNYIGKEVMVDGRVGKIQKNVYGDSMVKFDDGTIVKVPKANIKPVQDIDALISKQTKEALAKPTPTKIEGVDVITGKKPTPTRIKVEEPKTKRTLPKKLKVKGVELKPKVTESSSFTNLREGLKEAADTKPSYKSKTKESRFRQKTMMESDVTPENIKKTIDANKLTYKSVINQKDYEFASSKVIKNYDEELSKFMTPTKSGGSLDTMRGEALFVDALAKGDYKLADEISSELSLRLTEAGQQIQAASFFKKLSPEGMVLYQQKIINKVNKIMEDVAEKQFSKIKSKKVDVQGTFKVEDMVDDIGWLKGYLDDLNKQCPL